MDFCFSYFVLDSRVGRQAYEQADDTLMTIANRCILMIGLKENFFTAFTADVLIIVS